MKKRWTLKITLALLAGAVVTWAVAWGCALASGKPAWVKNAEVRTCPIEVPQGWRLSQYTKYVSARCAEEAWTEDLGGVQRLAWLKSFGWPARALGCSLVDDGMGSGPPMSAVVPTPEFLKRGRRHDGLPIGVLPLGFTLNTLLAAAVILTLTEGAGVLRRRARRRKGRCPWCGYDRAGVAADAACPECGKS